MQPHDTPVAAKPEGGEKHTTTFLVDNESYSTTEKELTVQQILSMSGNVPEGNFRLIEYRGQSQQEVRHDDLNERVSVHEQQRFAAAYKGETPLS